MSKERKLAIKYADTWFSKFIRMRDQKCYTCGSQVNLQCGHLFSRVFQATRWNEEAAFAQCERCNSEHESNTEPFYKKFIDENGLELFEYLERLTKSPILKTEHEIRYLGKKFKHKYEELLEGRGWNE